ncbi:MAG: signal peptide peptidase SppA [Nanoarchaeota archaeon]|nr:signal peptide peptidase SppA [Nanoarchaeota archaeon]
MERGVKTRFSILKNWKFSFFLVLLLSLSLLFLSACEGPKEGNVALIKVEGVITGNGDGSFLSSGTLSSQDIVRFIEDAEADPRIEAIMIEINSPGGSAVASDEIATALIKTTKPTVAVIREVGASGGYWVASATDHIVANRMSITGSIGVISSYLEFSGLMEKYGVEYQRLVAGERKDLGTPLRSLTQEEEALLQNKLDLIHDYFIQAVAENRNMDEEQVRQVSTGEFFLGIEAYQYGLIDDLGDKSVAEAYLKENCDIEEVEYYVYELEMGLFDLFSSVFSDFSFEMGEGIGSMLVKGSSGELKIFT